MSCAVGRRRCMDGALPCAVDEEEEEGGGYRGKNETIIFVHTHS